MAPEPTKPDFSGYITRYGVKCSDGRTILAHAFKEAHGIQVPLVWQHQHDSPENILGHLQLEHADDGVIGRAFFNDTDQGQHAKKLVQHKDINALSIFANQLQQSGMNVTGGKIREGSLVLAGANPGAFIQDVALEHGDSGNVVEAIIWSGDIGTEDELEHSTIAPPARVIPSKGAMPAPSAPTSGDEGGQTVEDVIASMSEEQRNVTFALVGAAAENAAEHSDTEDGDPSGTITHQEGGADVPRNIFDQTDEGKGPKGSTLSHDDMKGIFADAQKGGSLKAAVESYALAHGIDDISTLFPYDQAVTDTPDFISRRMEWVQGVLSGTRKTPFSRIRSWTADITFQEARAKGYIKGNLKKEEFFRISKRITMPQTIYKKQKLDRDDILDITEFDVVQWLQTEMRIMLDEELARAILIGDGRDVDDPDKIDTSNVRPIFGDDEMYVTPVNVSSTAIASSADAIVDAVVNAMRFYRGSGNPTMYTTRVWLAKMLLAKDTLNRRLYPTTVELSAALGVSNIIPCEALESEPDLIGLIVNLNDYTVGADKGGEVSMFDFFDIDYNQFKYLMETRVSGAMVKYRGAISLSQFSGVGGLLADPATPTFDNTTGVATVADASALHYTFVTVAEDGTESSALSAGAQTAIASGAYVTIKAKPASTYEFATDAFEWTFRRD